MNAAHCNKPCLFCKTFWLLKWVARNDGEIVLKHPNTDWKLVAHESDADGPDKPFQHQYGVRVATNREIDEAHEYLQSKKRENTRSKSSNLKKTITRTRSIFLNPEEISGRSNLTRKPMKPVWVQPRALTGELQSAKRSFQGTGTFLRR
jgi:hypothetical protein